MCWTPRRRTNSTYSGVSINSVFWDSPVQAISKEKGSMANADALNPKRLLSAMKQAPNAKPGHRMDTIYLAGDKELGCLEIGGTSDISKAMKDGQMKLPIVMKDMLLRIAKTTNIRVTDIRIVGYKSVVWLSS
ncbi:uncharacterized protein BYT42DRAFT_558157 [Radiomyces spectabilis]|uniref:uncharacterized protein n=1 Tax=Radiomyces spectabilis TaxID=64574 RepID=UPI00221F6A7C|nr:uncharacterized protein BYT42DRAFT_558157 [Radiomyces spectabilis]KAI8391810.1 hypothetical protein BYT42DRAFT_558157 [Radiomyces spectabilis]